MPIKDIPDKTEQPELLSNFFIAQSGRLCNQGDTIL